MLIIYRILYFLFSNLLLVVQFILPFNFKLWIKLRRQKTTVYPSTAPRILFHAASGEIEYVKSIIRNIKQQKPHIEIYVSYTSPSAEKLFQNISSEVTAFLPLPWDLPTPVKSFLNQVHPNVIIISRTDFWPELINQAHLLKIPMIAVSLFPTRGYFQNIWLKFVLSKMSLITVVTKELSEQLGTLLQQKIKVIHVPDTRYDQEIHRLQNPTKFEVRSDQKICVFARR